MLSLRRAPSLEAAMATLALPGLALGHRTITAGDENALLPDEIAAFAGSVEKVRRASGAARRVARQLMARSGRLAQAVPRSASGAPMWPDGVVGSLAHDATVAVAALASAADFMSIGIDIEPAEALEPELLDVIATPAERQQLASQDCGQDIGSRLLFAAKEAVYKAVHPLDGVFLDHHDVEVDVANCNATVLRTGRVVPLRFAVADHIVALAYIARE